MNIFGGHYFNRILNTATNIFELEVREIILDYLLKSNSFLNQFKYILHGYTGSKNAGFSKSN